MANTGSVAIIGSGLAALGAAIACSEAGRAFDVFDSSEQLPTELLSVSQKLSSKEPGDWSDADWEAKLGASFRGARSKSKSVFGSDFFLAKEIPRFVHHTKRSGYAPQSLAFGGMASGWGASALPLSNQQLIRWQELGVDLAEGYRAVLARVPYSFRDDALSTRYGSFGAIGKDLVRDTGAEDFLERVVSGFSRFSGTIVGSARLMLDASSSGCRGCGACMSGCPYTAIFSPGTLVKQMAEGSGGKFLPGCHLESIAEESDSVSLFFLRNDSSRLIADYDHVFLATGAFSTLQILAKSGFDFDGATLDARSGFVMVGLDLKTMTPSEAQDSTYRRKNSLPSAFIEFHDFAPGTPAHVQVSFQNELIGPDPRESFSHSNSKANFQSLILKRLRPFFVNFANELASSYVLHTHENTIVGTTLRRKRVPPGVLARLFWRLSVGMLRTGLIPIPLKVDNSGSYHVGSARDKSGEPIFGYHGDVPGFRRVLVVDSSVLPELPGSTLGLTIPANAFRIVSGRFAGKH